MHAMHGRPHLVFAGLGLSLALATWACSKTEEDGPSAATTAAASTTPAAATAPPSSEATPAPRATGAVTDAAGIADAAASAAPDAAPDLTGEGVCGKKPLPDCPMQAWMKANTSAAVAKNDLPTLAAALDKMAGFAPSGYGNWASISKDGAKAARGGDMAATKASCRTCHEQYKERYKKEWRTRKV
jgi:hypothetical protein